MVTSCVPAGAKPGAATRHKAWVASIFGLAIAALVAMHAPGMNGTWYWKWRWDPIEPQWFIPPMLGAYLLHLYGQYLYQRYRRALVPLALFAACTFSMQIIGRAMQEVPPSLEPMTFLVRNPLSTSYYDDAVRLLTEPGRPGVREWLATYPEQLPEMRPHSKFKPPGLVLGFVGLIKVFGHEGHRAAMIGAFVIAGLAAAGVPAVYLLLRRMLRDRDAALGGAAYFALCPSVIVFFPQLDQTYPILTCAMVLLWYTALRRKSTAAAIGFGVVLALALFLSYVFLVLGVTLLGLAALCAVRLRGRGVRRTVRATLIGGWTIVAAYLLLWLATGFNPIETYHAIVELHTIGVEELNRPAYPIHVPFDLFEFFTGIGWIGVMLAGFCLARPRGHGEHVGRRWLAWLAVAQILVVAAAGLWPGETARIWLPLIPVAMIPVALELRDWSFRQRAAVLSTLWLITTILWQNARFVS